MINKIIYDKYPDLSNSFEAVFHDLLDMLLQKSANIRGSVDDVLSLSYMQPIIKKVQSANPGYYEEESI